MDKKAGLHGGWRPAFSLSSGNLPLIIKAHCKDFGGKFMKKMLALMVCLSLLGIAWSAAAYARVITFEDLYPGNETAGDIPSGYEGLTWGGSYWVTEVSPSHNWV